MSSVVDWVEGRGSQKRGGRRCMGSHADEWGLHRGAEVDEG